MSANIGYGDIDLEKVHPVPWGGCATSIARHTRATVWLPLVCLLIFPLSGCKSSHAHEAAAIAQQGSRTAQALALYYHRMAVAAAEMPRARVVEDTLSARMILPEDTVALSQAYRVQAGHYAAREAMAENLKALYDELDNLAEDKPDDVIGAAANLQSAITKINTGHCFGASLSGRHIDNVLIQKHFDKVVSFLFDLQKSGKLREGNADTLKILTELKGILEQEEALYVEDASVFAGEGHSLATAMTKANFATSANAEPLGSASPLQELLAPYGLQSTQANAADVSNVGQVLTSFSVEEGYQDAKETASTAPADLLTAVNAQITRQEAFSRETR